MGRFHLSLSSFRLFNYIRVAMNKVQNVCPDSFRQTFVARILEELLRNPDTKPEVQVGFSERNREVVFTFRQEKIGRRRLPKFASVKSDSRIITQPLIMGVVRRIIKSYSPPRVWAYPQSRSLFVSQHLQHAVARDSTRNRIVEKYGNRVFSQGFQI